MTNSKDGLPREMHETKKSPRTQEDIAESQVRLTPHLTDLETGTKDWKTGCFRVSQADQPREFKLLYAFEVDNLSALRLNGIGCFLDRLSLSRLPFRFLHNRCVSSNHLNIP